ncbi:guanine permease [Phormidium willei BDU 130791]|nr:guanine permease [Phormidium willei BDU 130791]
MANPRPLSSGLARVAAFFEFSVLKTGFRREAIAAVTTFVTMAYILAVNPAILSNAIFLETPGDLFGELVVATALAAAIATLVMGLYAKYPFALAPGMGLNAYFAFSVVLGLGIPWPVALGAVFVEGVVFMILTALNLRGAIVRAIPDSLKYATSAGIGLFIAYIGLTRSAIIVADETTVTSLNDISQGIPAVTLLGLLMTAVFVVQRLRGALLWGIVATAVLGWMFALAPGPEAVVSVPPLPVHLFGQAWLGLREALSVNPGQFLTVMVVFLFVDFFDTVGTLTGLGVKAGYLREGQEFPRLNRAFMADAVGTTVGAILGTSTTTAYVESAAGVSEGGRSGFTAVVVAGLFVVSILFTPLLAGIPEFATAPVLMIVGVLMMGTVRQIDWDDPAESISAFLTMVMMPLSYSIADGLAVGAIAYPLLKSCQGRFREIPVAMWGLAGLFLIKFVILN